MNNPWLGSGVRGGAGRPASSFPEIIHGEHVMRHPGDLDIGSFGFEGFLARSPRALGFCVLVVAAMMAFP